MSEASGELGQQATAKINSSIAECMRMARRRMLLPKPEFLLSATCLCRTIIWTLGGRGRGERGVEASAQKETEETVGPHLALEERGCSR